MNGAFTIAVPAKGRLQENAEAFFARAGLALIKPRGARDYRGTVAGLPNVEVAYLSAAEIAGQLAQGMVHLGVTGEDLLREMIHDADQRIVMIEGLGFGHANVVVAVPQAWIDVRSMADLDDVATAFRHRRDRDVGFPDHGARYCSVGGRKKRQGRNPAFSWNKVTSETRLRHDTHQAATGSPAWRSSHSPPGRVRNST